MTTKGVSLPRKRLNFVKFVAKVIDHLADDVVDLDIAGKAEEDGITGIPEGIDLERLMSDPLVKERFKGIVITIMDMIEQELDD